MSRYFSSSARALLKFIWKGTESVLSYEETLRAKLPKNSKLEGADTVEIAGKPHTSFADPDLRVSGKVFKDGERLTSVHVYENGKVVYSKQSINDAQGD